MRTIVMLDEQGGKDYKLKLYDQFVRQRHPFIHTTYILFNKYRRMYRNRNDIHTCIKKKHASHLNMQSIQNEQSQQIESRARFVITIIRVDIQLSI